MVRVDSAGRFWAGTTTDDATPDAAALYRLETDGSVATMLTDVGWGSDDKLLHFVDGFAHDVDAAGGTISRRRFIDIPPSDGVPDGLTVDVEGFLWLRLWDGWAVRQYVPDDSLDAVVDLPISRVKSCFFGGR